ncbi:hypothetical protein ACQPYV_22775 [Micromonospora saelicesensis]|uniref:hypothetical protein n=2 Tax=Micromonospora saelicesensis TaxID=285676 RepID=UPI003D89BB6C
MRIIAEALFSADFQHRTYIQQAVTAVFMVFAEERDRAVEACDALSLDANAQAREGAVELREMPPQVDPLLFPQDPALAAGESQSEASRMSCRVGWGGPSLHRASSRLPGETYTVLRSKRNRHLRPVAPAVGSIDRRHPKVGLHVRPW